MTTTNNALLIAIAFLAVVGGVLYFLWTAPAAPGPSEAAGSLSGTVIAP